MTRPSAESQRPSPDPAIYKFETGTGYEIRPVIQPVGQSVVFYFNYLYAAKVREPVRVDEKHLGRVKQPFIDTEIQTANYESREVGRYQPALKASRNSRGVPRLEHVPGLGTLFRHSVVQPLANPFSNPESRALPAQGRIPLSSPLTSRPAQNVAVTLTLKSAGYYSLQRNNSARAANPQGKPMLSEPKLRPHRRARGYGPAPTLRTQNLARRTQRRTQNPILRPAQKCPFVPRKIIFPTVSDDPDANSLAIYSRRLCLP
jgi:hypothetical protein